MSIWALGLDGHSATSLNTKKEIEKEKSQEIEREQQWARFPMSIQH